VMIGNAAHIVARTWCPLVGALDGKPPTGLSGASSDGTATGIRTTARAGNVQSEEPK